MKKIFLTAVFFFTATSFCFAFDWKALHEKADALTLKQAEEAARLAPDSGESMYVLGLAYFTAHKDIEARREFEKILSEDPASIPAQWGLAESLRRIHNADAAKKLLEKIIKTDPAFYPAYVSLGYIQFIQHDPEAAVRSALKVIKRNRSEVDLSNYVRAHTLYGGAKGIIAHNGGPLSKIVNGTAVSRALNDAERLQPDNVMVLFGQGSYYLLAPALAGGDLEKAKRYLDRSLEKDPLFADVYVRIGEWYKIKGDERKYDEFLEKALAIDPQNELALDVKNKTCTYVCADTR